MTETNFHFIVASSDLSASYRAIRILVLIAMFGTGSWSLLAALYAKRFYSLQTGARIPVWFGRMFSVAMGLLLMGFAVYFWNR
jgi:hypothetical protein